MMTCQWHTGMFQWKDRTQTVPQYSLFPFSRLFLLAGARRWSGGSHRPETSDCHATVYLPANYRDPTSITKWQSAALIQNYYKAWSIIYRHSHLLKLSESLWQMGKDIKVWKDVYMDITSMQSPCVDISVPFPNPHCLDTTNIWLCQSNLTSYRWVEAVSRGGSEWDGRKVWE